MKPDTFTLCLRPHIFPTSFLLLFYFYSAGVDLGRNALGVTVGRVFAWLLLESTRVGTTSSVGTGSVGTGSALLDRRMEILLLLLDSGSHPAVREASTQQVRGEERERREVEGK